MQGVTLCKIVFSFVLLAYAVPSFALTLPVSDEVQALSVLRAKNKCEKYLRVKCKGGELSNITHDIKQVDLDKFVDKCKALCTIPDDGLRDAVYDSTEGYTINTNSFEESLK